MEITGVQIEQNEMGFISMHLGAALERLKLSTKNHIRIALICNSGFGHAQFLYAKLQSIVGTEVRIIGPFSSFEMNQVIDLNPDMLISTFNVEYPHEISSVIISLLPTDKDIFNVQNLVYGYAEALKSKRISSHIRRFFHKDLFYPSLDLENADEVIAYMANNLEKKGYVGQSFESLVFQRERISPTSFNNLIAIPHAIEAGAMKTVVSVAILKKTIKWGENQAQIIFMFAAEKGKQSQLKDIYRIIEELIDGNIIQVNKLLRIEDFTDFLTTILPRGAFT